MEESICLDDDLLSPQLEDIPPKSPLAQLDAIQQEEEEEEAASAGVSMENVKLETSPTIESISLAAEEESAQDTSLADADDLLLTGSQVTTETEIADLSTSVPTAEPEPLMDLPVDIEEIGEGVEVRVEGGEESKDTPDEEKETPDALSLNSASEKEDENLSDAAGLSSYFASSPLGGQDSEAKSFFDELSDRQLSEGGDKDDDEVGALMKQRTTSMGSSGSATEATTVSFQESKGVGMKFVGSMQNVSKFFVEDDVGGGNDVEGKNFFDTFTAADGEEPVINVASSPKPEGISLSQSAGASSITLPTAPSPLPSPLHAALPRSRTTSQSSPMASPIHMLHSKEPPLPTSPETGQKAADLLQSAFQGGDDPFFASLNMSDMDRRNDAWIPSEMTRQALMSMVSNPPGSHYPEVEQLTRPGIIAEDLLGDPVHDLVQKYMGDAEANKRVTLTAGDVQQNEDGLRKLISEECYRSAIDLTGRLLTQVGQGFGKLGAATKHTPYTLQLWFTRLALQMKLRLYNHAESECQAFGSLDRPDLFYDYYADAYPGRRGSMVPFEMRVLCAELPQYLGKSQESLDMLHYIHGVTQTILANLESGLAEDGSMLQLSTDSRRVARVLWESRQQRVLYALGNCLLNIKDYQTAVTIFEQLLKMTEGDQSALLCGIGRIYLQMGDIKSGEKYFLKAEAGSKDNCPKTKCRDLMNKGFVALGQNQFPEAQKFFQDAVTVEPTNAVAVNNMAVCSLYMGRLKEALSTLEQLIHTDPARFLQEGLLFNLCTLYELESSRAIHKKQALLDLVSKYKGNGFNTACLKIQ